jgi:hypothetical protein
MNDRDIMRLKLDARLESKDWCDKIAGAVERKRRMHVRRRVSSVLAVCAAGIGLLLAVPYLPGTDSIREKNITVTGQAGSYVLQQVSGTEPPCMGQTGRFLKRRIFMTMAMTLIRF